MSSTSLNSLSQQASKTTASHTSGTGEALPPLVCAGQDPLQELLVRDVAQRLPPPVRDRMLASQTADQVDGWLVAGAIYPLIAQHTHLAARYLDEIARGNPANPALAVARAYGEERVNPERSAEWWWLDVLGAGLQLLVSLCLLLLRALVVLLVAHWAAASSEAAIPWLARLVEAMFAWPLLAVTLNESLLSETIVAMLVIWLAVEAVAGPRLMETARRLPFRWQQESLPLVCRIEGLYVLWSMSAIGTSLAVWIRLCIHQIGTLHDGQWPAVVARAVLSLISLGTIVALAPRVRPSVLAGTGKP